MYRLVALVLSYFSFIEAAFAQAAGAPSAPNPIFMFLIVIVVMYFFMIRPQMKRNREMQDMLNSLKKGDKIITTGGIAGIVKKVDETSDLLEVEIASGVIVQVIRSLVSNKVGEDSPLEGKIGKIKSTSAVADKKTSKTAKSSKTPAKRTTKKEVKSEEDSSEEEK